MFFTSDTHFFHKNVIKSCGRPFRTVEEMHRELIARWNAVVKPRSMIWVLGDFSFGGIHATKEVMDQLNGDKRLVKGNHDKHARQMISMGFTNVYENHYIDIDIAGKRTRVNMSHFPYYPTEKQLKEGVDQRYLHKRMVDDGRFLLHGHVHNAWTRKGRMINVGADRWDYRPVSHHQLAEWMEAIPRLEEMNDRFDEQNTSLGQRVRSACKHWFTR